jgi:hypothetical protein
MAFAPQQNWQMLDRIALASDSEWVRSLTPSDRFAIYADLFDMIWEARGNRGNWERLDEWNWRQKLALRLRMVEAFKKPDHARNERSNSHDAR